MSGQSDMGTNLLPDLYRFVRVQFQINHFLFSEKYANLFTDKALLSIRCMVKSLGKISPSPYDIVQKVR